MKSIGRRQFVTTSLGAAAAAAAARRSAAAADHITLGVIGVGNRGTSWVKDLASRDGVQIAYLCDVDSTRFERAAEIVDSAGLPSPKQVQDFRRILDDPTVQAVVVATNYHWLGLATILACQAGKDVYVEKPGSHNVWEARKMVEAARKHGRVVQVGLQGRSATYMQQARDYVQSGKLGELHLVRVLSMNEERLRPKGPDTPPPATLDWDAWCGPAPVQPYSPGTWHVNRFDYGVGRIVDDLVHQADTAVYITGLGAPQTVANAGGVYHYKDGRDFPDTQLTTFEYPGLKLLFQSTLWAQYIRETPSVVRDGDLFPDWLLNGTKVELFGTEGMMLVGPHGAGWQVYDNDQKIVASSYGRRGDKEHMSNFLECVRSRKRPIADVEDAFPSMLLCHLGNVSWRAGDRKLSYDAATGWIRNDPEANAFMQRRGRKPWLIPDEV